MGDSGPFARLLDAAAVNTVEIEFVALLLEVLVRNLEISKDGNEVKS